MVILTDIKNQGILIRRGDFTESFDPRLDSSSGNSDSKGISKKTNVLMEEMGVIDVWREITPSSRDYTHSSYSHTVYSRINYFFIFNGDLHRIGQCDIGLVTLSDHSPIYSILYISVSQY